MIDFWIRVLGELEADREVFLAFVAKCTKGSPGTPKARLLVFRDGSQEGTIGGGIMERRMLDFAALALRQRDFAPQLHTISHHPKSDAPSGLICGGSQSNVVAVLKPNRDTGTVAEIIDYLQGDDSASIRISPDGLELFRYTDTNHPPAFLIENGGNWELRISTHNHRRVAIFGAGHCGQALAAQMLRLGYHVTLSDQRETISLSRDTDGALALISFEPSEACWEIKHWEHTAVIVMTHSYPTDLDALIAALPYKSPFVGVMGSPSKLRKIRHELAANGISREQIASLRAPVGLAIGSDTPEEIAVSIAAQLIQEQSSNSIHAPTAANYFSS